MSQLRTGNRTKNLSPKLLRVETTHFLLGYFHWGPGKTRTNQHLSPRACSASTRLYGRATQSKAEQDSSPSQREPKKSPSGKDPSLSRADTMSSLDRHAATGQQDSRHVTEALLNLVFDFCICTDAKHVLVLQTCSLIYYYIVLSLLHTNWAEAW